MRVFVVQKPCEAAEREPSAIRETVRQMSVIARQITLDVLTMNPYQICRVKMVFVKKS
jgi:hypothetical protein